jgi:hypothetical protein
MFIRLSKSVSCLVMQVFVLITQTSSSSSPSAPSNPTKQHGFYPTKAVKTGELKDGSEAAVRLFFENTKGLISLPESPAQQCPQQRLIS